MFSDLTADLMKGGMEDKLFAALRTNIEACKPVIGGSTAPGTIAGRMAAIMKEFGTMGTSVSRGCSSTHV